MVASGGYVSAMAATKSKDLRRAYVDAMNAEVLGPLGMTATALDLDVARKREHARPHGRTLTFDAEPIATEIERGVDSVMPAGGAWSNVRDLSRWLLLELGKGSLDGKQMVSEANMLERRKPRVKISAKQSYGLALFIDESRGLLSIGHGGNTFGFTADATFFPEHDLALVVLTNAAASNAYTGAVRRRLVELLLDANEEARDRISRSASSSSATRIKKQLEEITMTADAGVRRAARSASGRIRVSGTIEIRRDGHGLRARCRRVEGADRRAQGQVGRAQDHPDRRRRLPASRSGRRRTREGPRCCSRPRSRSTWFERAAVSSR